MAQSDPNSNAMQSILAAARQVEAEGSGLPPVERWNPDHCGVMDMVIKRDGSWWHEGTRIAREPLIQLFSRILRKDDDGKTYLVTPVEQVEITVEAGHFLAIDLEVTGEGKDQIIAFTTDRHDSVMAGPDHPIRCSLDPETGEPDPYVHIRGRLEALITRAVFYELADLAIEGEIEGRSVMGVWSKGVFFALGPRA
ncbi:DUF1285 domain-containing protein [Woodsholea maritima]|uniref:DUF1285 domain-containing protein n=1 Tax=Woodsholea maritima TaxID=240237 RepID=UPI00037D6227|nr:DUF1285 domain-containing protein [Woodsholea maritima]